VPGKLHGCCQARTGPGSPAWPAGAAPPSSACT
jgi:hypothetical protein